MESRQSQSRRSFFDFMDTRLLRVFSAVAESGSLVVAAGKVHLTPSAISHSLKSLETDLGCRLFERVGKRMVLNQAGEQLLAHIQGPLSALDLAAEAIRRLGKWGQTRLRIAAAASACQHILPKVIRELKKNDGNIELRIESGDTPRAIDLLRNNKVDLAVGIAPETAAGLDVRPLFRDELMFVFSSAHPWSDGRPISRDEIRSQQFIVYQRASVTSELIDEHFRQLEIVPNTAMEVDSIGAIIELLKLNLGVSVLAPWTVENELTRGTLKMRPLGAKPVRRPWAAISLSTRRMTLAEENFCRLCRNQAASMRLDRGDVPPVK
ncbi:MAG TPA: LysR family transcriptional regulator [Verrucomicrobiae bacterium]|nr:LysR family transcriptional regulator [Verrucomicrobiae bacterium]